jgi:O-antigen/teichoic acid export membrane protein
MIEQHSSLTEKFIKKGVWLYLFSFIIAPIWYIIKIIISWELSVDEVWILYWVLSLIILLSSFNDFWMTESLSYFIPKYITEKRYDKVKSILVYAFWAQTITWIIIALLMFFWADFLSEHYFESEASKNIIQIFALYFLGINVFQVFNGFFLVIQNTFYNKIGDLLRMLFTLFFILWIFFSDIWSITIYSLSWIWWLYIWILFVLYFFYTKYYKIYLKSEKIIWSKEFFNSIFSYAIIVFVWAQAATILSQVDMQMIIYILWTTDAWYYTNYLSIIGIPFLLIGPIFMLLFPIFSELHSKKQYEKIKLIKQIFQKNFTAIATAFNILFFVFAEIIAFVLFWEKFIKSWAILQYSILFLVFNFMLQINFHILAWIGKVKQRMKIILSAVVFNAILNIILINIIWVSWAALATWIGWIFIWILSEHTLWKQYSTSFNYKFLLKNIFALGTLWIFFYYTVTPLFEWLSRIQSFFLMWLVWSIWFALFWAINWREWKAFIWEIKKFRKV